MMNTETDIWTIITKVDNGEADSAEREEFDRWINENEQNKLLYIALTKTKIKDPEIKDDVKAKIYKNLHETIIYRRASKKLRFWRYCAAASIAIIVALGSYIYFNNSVKPQVSYLEAQVPLGVRSKITLSDGTIVHLNSGSSLKYPNQFTGNQRNVRLEGEGYFEVRKDDSAPFIVQTKQLNIKVLGTRFNVKAFNDEDYIETTLLEGKVALYRSTGSAQKDETILKPNTQAIYNKNSDKFIIKEVDASLSTIWKDGKYYFENEPLASIVRKLERNFNVTIIITSPELGNESFYGLFNTDKNLFQLLDIMKLHNSFTYQIRKDTIYITKK
jgi:ferric-dicitrate binding protein FerR (iron transport regulator)